MQRRTFFAALAASPLVMLTDNAVAETKTPQRHLETYMKIARRVVERSTVPKLAFGHCFDRKGNKAPDVLRWNSEARVWECVFHIEGTRGIVSVSLSEKLDKGYLAWQHEVDHAVRHMQEVYAEFNAGLRPLESMEHGRIWRRS